MRRQAEIDDRRAQAIAILGIAGALMLPAAPPWVLWLMSREPLFSGLRNAVSNLRTVLRSQTLWVAVGAAALARARLRANAPAAS